MPNEGAPVESLPRNYGIVSMTAPAPFLPSFSLGGAVVLWIVSNWEVQHTALEYWTSQRPQKTLDRCLLLLTQPVCLYTHLHTLYCKWCSICCKGPAVSLFTQNSLSGQTELRFFLFLILNAVLIWAFQLTTRITWVWFPCHVSRILIVKI